VVTVASNARRLGRIDFDDLQYVRCFRTSAVRSRRLA
jgi:hypothetical protein